MPVLEEAVPRLYLENGVGSNVLSGGRRWLKCTTWRTAMAQMYYLEDGDGSNVLPGGRRWHICCRVAEGRRCRLYLENGDRCTNWRTTVTHCCSVAEGRRCRLYLENGDSSNALRYLEVDGVPTVCLDFVTILWGTVHLCITSLS